MSAAVLYDGVKETTATTGTGNRVLLGASTGFRMVSTVMVDGDVGPFSIRGANEWETGIYRYNSGANSLTPLEIHASSNAGAVVNFSAGTKDVVHGLVAKMLPPISAFPFTAATGLLARYKIGTGRTDVAGNGYATKIYDISGNGYHSSTNSGNPPKYVGRAHSLHDLPALYFDGGQRLVVPTMPAIASPLACTIFVIASDLVSASGNSHIYNYNGNPIGFGSTRPTDYMYNGTLPSAFTQAAQILTEHVPNGWLTYPVVIIHSYNGVSSISAVNGVEQGNSPGTAATGTGNAGFTIGGDSSVSGAAYIRGHIHELAVLNFAASTAQRALLNEYGKAVLRTQF